MRISRGTAVALFAFGVWSWVIWITFAKNLWASNQSWAADGSPTGYFVVHAILTVASFVFGTAIGVLGWRGIRATAKERADA